MNKTLVLWGDTQVGKTALLATAFALSPPNGIDLENSQKSLSLLFEHYSRLTTQMHTESTSKEVDFEFVSTGGHELRIRDIKGGDVRNAHDESVVAILRTGHVVLFLVEWLARDIENQMNAILGARNQCQQAAKGLVFTKCELGLAMDDDAWEAKTGWWRRNDRLGRYEEIITQFENAVWPTSSFGYDDNNGRPAVMHGEFGDLVPFHIKPKLVTRPFEWALDRMTAE